MIALSNFFLEANQLKFAITAQQFGVSDWVWIIVFIMVLALVWWLLSRSTRQSEVEETEIETQVAEERTKEVAHVDDLTRIEGIGPKINSLLQEAGISSFAQLADTDVSKLDEILNTAGITIADPKTWPEQAELAAGDQWEELEKLQDELSGGREKKRR
jgi:predicted flap endonuclease-1-like 5' DNA nuclease